MFNIFQSQKPKINTDPEIIEELLFRSVASVFPSKDLFKKALLSGKRLKFYVGADATGPELHLGHATNFMFMEKVRSLGHEVVILFGDFTAMIGDPSGKDAQRKQLTQKQVDKNIKSWKSQVSKIVRFTGSNKAKIVKNGEWLSKLSFEKVLKLSSNFTVQQMLERDMFQKRIEGGKPIYIHEFMYPLMQGYDSVALDVDVEVGGNDQTFNMLAGRTLQKIYKNKEKFVVATTLLVNPKTGKKLMSKSEGGYVALNDKPNEMYGKIMSLPDEVIVSVFIDCTYVPLNEIEEIKKLLASGKNPKEIKMRLAREVVEIYHGKKLAQKAEENFVKTFSEGGIPENIQKVGAKNGDKLADVLLKAQVVSSKSDFRRLVNEGAISDTSNNSKITDPNLTVSSAAVLKVGKKRFIEIEII